MNSVKALVGVLAGLATGAALGILFAPEKGSTTRKKIAKGSNDYVDVLNDKFNEFVGNMTQKFEFMIAETTEMAENGKAKAESTAHEMATSINSKVREMTN